MSTVFFKRPVVRHIAAGSMLAASVLGLSYAAHGYWSDPHDVRVSIPVADTHLSIETEGFLTSGPIDPEGKNGLIQANPENPGVGLDLHLDNSPAFYNLTGGEDSRYIPFPVSEYKLDPAVFDKLDRDGSAVMRITVKSDNPDHRATIVGFQDGTFSTSSLSGRTTSLEARKGFTATADKCTVEHLKANPSDLYTTPEEAETAGFAQGFPDSTNYDAPFSNLVGNISPEPDYRTKGEITYCQIITKEDIVGTEGDYQNTITVNATTMDGEKEVEVQGTDTWDAHVRPKDFTKANKDFIDYLKNEVVKTDEEYDSPMSVTVMPITNRTVVTPTPEEE